MAGKQVGMGVRGRPVFASREGTARGGDRWRGMAGAAQFRFSCALEARQGGIPRPGARAYETRARTRGPILAGGEGEAGGGGWSSAPPSRGGPSWR